MKTVSTPWWHLELPEEWSVEQDDEIVVICDTDDVGSIEISTLLVDGGGVTVADLRDIIAESELDPATAKSSAVGAMQGLYLEHEEDGEYLREWYLTTGTMVLFITYGCDLENAELDDSVVDEILSTLELLSGE